MEVAYLRTETVQQIARRLTTWHIMDLNLVYKQGFMRVASKMPRGKTGELIDWGVLEFCPDTHAGFILKPTRLFLRVRRAALHRQSSQGSAA